MTAAAVRELGSGWWEIDHRFGGMPGVIASYLFAEGGDLLLVETGPASTLDTLLAGIRATGNEPERIGRVLLTHIHLDHAGAAGTLARVAPEARFGVHELGAPHLADPSRLLRSAGRIYGDRMDELWGKTLPVPAERLEVMAEGEQVRAGSLTLQALDTPGHAAHHLAFHEPEGGWVFTGDVGGVRVGGAAYVRPPTVPPETDIAAWRGSIARIRALHPRRLLPTHFGAWDDPDWHLDDLLSRLYRLVGWAEGRLAAGIDGARLGEELRERTRAELAGDEALAILYERAVASGMMADALVRALRAPR